MSMKREANVKSILKEQARSKKKRMKEMRQKAEERKKCIKKNKITKYSICVLSKAVTTAAPAATQKRVENEE